MNPLVKSGSDDPIPFGDINFVFSDEGSFTISVKPAVSRPRLLSPSLLPSELEVERHHYVLCSSSMEEEDEIVGYFGLSNLTRTTKGSLVISHAYESITSLD